jgi:hypothetical protein
MVSRQRLVSAAASVAEMGGQSEHMFVVDRRRVCGCAVVDGDARQWRSQERYQRRF